MFSVFEYLYRDASNFKAWGALLLAGKASTSDRANIRAALESGEFFIAEQLGIPSLYDGLWKLSAGPSKDDHVWHSFHALRDPTEQEQLLPVWGTTRDMVSRFTAVTQWNEELSPHWEI